MTTVAQLRVTPVPGSPARLKECFVAAMNFQPVQPSSDKDDIKSAAQTESASGIPLRTDDDTGLTRGMRAHCIQPATNVLSNWMRVRGEFDTELQPFIPKIEALATLDNKIQKLQQEYDHTQERIEQEHRTKEKYASVEEDYQRAERLYNEHLLNEGNRPVKIPPWYYWILLAILGSVEFLINYEALYRSFGEIVGLAAGSALIVAIVIAAISHVHGTVLKQWRSWFGPDIEHRDRYWRAGLVALATLGLVCVLIFVAYTRYDMAMQLLRHASPASGSILGPSQLQTNPVTDVVMTMLMNTAVWIAGVVVAYWLHDENRRYVEAAQDYWKRRTVYHRHRKQIERQIGVEQAKLATQLQAAKNKAEVLSREASEERDMRDKIKSRDKEIERSILAAARDKVETYQYWLCLAGAVNGLKIRQGDKEYTSQEYQHVHIAVSPELLRSRVQ